MEFKRALLGVTPPQRIYTHIVGTDLIRNDRGEYLILEDNCRCPSGVSYVLENRNLLHRVFPEFFTLLSGPAHPRLSAPPAGDPPLRRRRGAARIPVVVVLTPGIYNSAFFEHSFLAREMGVISWRGAT